MIISSGFNKEISLPDSFFQFPAVLVEEWFKIQVISYCDIFKIGTKIIIFTIYYFAVFNNLKT